MAVVVGIVDHLALLSGGILPGYKHGSKIYFSGAKRCVMVSIRASGPGLIAIDGARRQRGWTKQAELWCQTAHTSRATLKRFWRGEAIDQGTFIAICQAVGLPWQEIAQTVAVRPRQSLDLRMMPDVPIFWGRDAELALLTDWSRRCRLITLWGLGGIGKTALVATWVEALVRLETSPQPFTAIVWHSLRYHPTLPAVTTAMMAAVGLRESASQLPLGQLLNRLQEQRCLLILDNWDVLLGGGLAGQVQPQFQEFSQLFQQLATVKHQSCVIVISREKPAELAGLEGTHPLVQAYKLVGMGADALELLKYRGLKVEEPAWQTLIQLYRGHPLSLNMIASLIQEMCQGSATTFLKLNTIVVHQLESVLAERVQCLSATELAVLKALAQAEQPLDLEVLQAQTPTIRPSQLLEILLSLERRCLLEIQSEAIAPFALAPVLQKYIVQKYIR